MDRFEGRCHGGPCDGKMLAHWSKTKKFYRPMMAVLLPRARLDDFTVEPIEIGEYRLNDFGQWHWWETESGRAFAKLYGPHALLSD